MGQPIHQPLPQHHVPTQPHPQFQQQPNQVPPSPPNTTGTTSIIKAPYGSGDHDDGYTLVFPNLEAFHAWRKQEEETQMVEFVKGDTHGSKAVPPRFKDHTKLVCARHSRSGRKKYVKKHPDRVRKVPSRKLEGQGCSASISYKTYYDTEEVRACYISQHSHEVGIANLPFTRRGRKAAVQQEKEKSKRFRTAEPSPSAVANTSTPAAPTTSASTSATGPASAPAPGTSTGPGTYTSTLSMLAPLPQTQQQPSAQPPPHFAGPPFAHPLPHTLPHNDRWERMHVLFNSIRDNSRSGFEFPGPSVAALESVLIRLYLESPVGGVLMGVNGMSVDHAVQSVSAPGLQGTAGGNDPGVNEMNNGPGS